MSDKINVEKRTETGTLRMRRLRKTGKVPAVLYGHGEGTVMLTASAKEVNRMIDHGSHIVNLSGAVTGSALVKDIQWDALGDNVLHFDLARVDANEKLEVSLPIELHGEAPGTKMGGSVKLVEHEISILCSAAAMPDKIECDISELQVDGVISAGDIKLPEGVELATVPEATIVSCAADTTADDDADAEADEAGDGA